MADTGMDKQGGKIDPPEPAGVREPLFNAPWPAVALLALLAGAFAAQMFLLTDEAAFNLALSPQALRAGMGWTLFSYMFLHGGWGHILMNGASALAFAPPVARATGERGRGPWVFAGFYLLCGLIAGLGFCLLHWAGSGPMVGASGAISGLWGAASRMLDRSQALAPLQNRQVIQQAIVFAAINVVLGMLGVFGGMNIAWEAHLFGYAAGLLLIGPALRLAAPREAITS